MVFRQECFGGWRGMSKIATQLMQPTSSCGMTLALVPLYHRFNGGTAMGDLNKKGAANEAKGSVKEAVGKVKGDVGDALDNSRMHAEGRGEQLKGKVQKTVGKVQRALDPDARRDVDDDDIDRS
jgi:uncharacterized protein YjbJ (UPF0337 family)